MEPIDFGPAAQHLAILVTGVGDDQRGAPTPCPAYQVGDLLEHIGTLALPFAAPARQDRGPPGHPPPRPGAAARLAADWRVSIPRDLGTLVQAWSAPGAWDGITRIAAMDSPAGMVGVTLADELVVHGSHLG